MNVPLSPDESLGELAARIARKLEPPGPAPSRIMEFLNSPFSVTVLGGLILWLAATLWQSQDQAALQQREAVDRLYDYRKALLLEFANQFPTTIDLARDFKYREIWIARHRGAAEPPVYADKGDYATTRMRYEKAKKDYLKQKSIFAFGAEIGATFESARTKELARTMTTQMETMLDAADDKAKATVAESVDALDGIYSELIASMSEELVATEGGQP